MTRHYIRLDPAFDEHKESYPDGAYAALIATLCLAEAQPQRGRFRSLDYLKRLLGKRGRWAKYLLEKGDVVLVKGGPGVYVDGWDEWQEGDWMVAERVRRIRSRRRVATAGETVEVTPDVTVAVTPDRSRDGNSPSNSRGSTNSGAVGGAVGGAQTIGRSADQVRGEELDGIDLFREGLPHLDEETLRLGRQITDTPSRQAGDRQLDELDRQLGKYGAEKVRSAMRRVPPHEKEMTWQRLVWGARKVLEPLWEGGKPESPKEREDRERLERAAVLNAEAAARRTAQGVA